MTHLPTIGRLLLLATFCTGCASVPEVESRLRTLQFHPNMYVVRAGDTLETIAFRYRLSPADLAALNPGLEPGALLASGLRINVRPGTELPQTVRTRALGEPSPRPEAVTTSPAVRPALTAAVTHPAPRPSVAATLPVERSGHGRDDDGRRDDRVSVRNANVSARDGYGSVRDEYGNVRDEYLLGEERVGTWPAERSGELRGERSDSSATPLPSVARVRNDARYPDAAYPREEIVPDDLDPGDAPADDTHDEELQRYVGRWSWPTDGAVARGFAPERVGGQGVDIAGVPGQDVRAALDGTVVYSGRDLSGDGNLVIVRHDDGLMTTYSHADQLFVAEDDRVLAGDPIASLGWNERRESVLRFEVRQDGSPLDPMAFLPVR